MPWVAFKLPHVELLAELSGQSLVEQDIGDNSPPGEREASKHHAERHVNEQLCKVMRTGHQLEPASTGNSMIKCLHCA